MNRKKIMELFENYNEYTDEKVKLGIEANRKGDVFIKVVDKDGNTIKGATVDVKQKNHEFRYGANLFMLDEFENDEKNELYKEYFKKAFNMATLPFYWNTLEPEKGYPRYDKNSPKVYRRPPIDLCIEFCEENGIEPREHALAYDHFFPSWLKGVDTFTVKNEFERRCREISERYADKIRTIEVTNEMFWDPKVSVTEFYNDPDFIEHCFKTARKYFPNNQLVINDWSGMCWDNGWPKNVYFNQIDQSLRRGAEIDAIGLQYHMFYPLDDEYTETRNFYNPLFLNKVMDKLATFGKPLQITEVTVPSYSWETEDEELQAEIIEKLYSIWFSHPSVEQIIYWNLVDGYAHVDDPEKIASSQGDMTLGENYYHGGLIRFDMTPKPAYNKICELFGERWRTNTETASNEYGNAYFRGFYGEYDITVTADGKTVSKTINVRKNKDNEFEVVL